MFLNNFAAAIFVNNTSLREIDGKVYIPYGTEYAIRLKNLSTNRALVNITIDGESVTGDGLVVTGTTDLERYITSNLSKGNKFKFIERTEKIEDHRGIRVDDGIIFIKYEFEKPPNYHYLDSLECSRSFGSRTKGITVPGSVSNQSFGTTSWRGTEGTASIINLQLVGEKIVAPVTVKSKLICKTCGTENTYDSKFCKECSTALVIY
jgi:hypothetical protein